ncbi:Sesquipedalian-1 [Portunus trituberculatus]|uniref:Sesquipedalian-1 n=1 Tax=Portunus trituberculatus TaxID=210409 RepID=A0A5B7GRK9_PORTR|nr:Sesquipedalian-1 [Portunus trituberculatus]
MITSPSLPRGLAPVCPVRTCWRTVLRVGGLEVKREDRHSLGFSVAGNMKINEKNLCAYSVSPTLIDKEGYLLKKGEVNKNFQRRWFVLKGNLLFYFEKKGDREPIGVIILEGCTIGQCSDGAWVELCIVI